jgi:hypothetical protein
MKLNIAMVVVCLISVLIFVAFPKNNAYAGYHTASVSASPAFQACWNLAPNEEQACDHISCGSEKIMVVNTNSASGPGDYSYEMRETDCKTNSNNCAISYPVQYFTRVDSNCCDRDSDNYYANTAFCLEPVINFKIW